MTISQYLSTIPIWLLVTVGLIVVFAIGLALYAKGAADRLDETSKRLAGALGNIGPLTDDVRLHGRPLAAVDQWRASLAKLGEVERSIGEDIERQLVAVIDDDGGTRYRLRDGEGPVWTTASVGGRFLNLPLVDAVPGMLTAIGLIGTFMAIAFGLGGLRQLDSGVIEGVSGLLGGLGGKFITSIAALTCALAFQGWDLMYLQRRISKAVQQITDAVSRAFPKQTAAQQMADLLQSARKQERALANISSDVVGAFGELFTSNLLPDLSTMLAKSVEAEIGPVMAQVSDRIKALDEGIKALDEGINRLESGKQESIGAELRELTGNLERSITAALTNMGKDFRTALSGTADQEFQQAAEAMRSSADVLKNVNTAFGAMQVTLERVLKEAEERASRSFEDGEGRTRALNQLVEQLVAQLNTSAQNSATQVQELLVKAVSGMGSKLADVTNDLETRVRSASEESIRSNKLVADQMADAAGKTTKETTQLLTTLAQRSQDFVAAADQLRELREGVERVLAETGARVNDLNQAASAFRSMATEAHSMSKALQDSSSTQRQTVEKAVGLMGSIGDTARTQLEAAERARIAFTTADQTMEALDERLNSVLEVIVNRMQDYNRQVERNFEVILGKVNSKMPELFDRLEASLKQVADVVEELAEASAELKKKK